mgnify:CR=1 FL=1
MTELGRDNCFAWRQRVASLILADQRSSPMPTQRGDRFARARIQRTALSREEKNSHEDFRLQALHFALLL